MKWMRPKIPLTPHTPTPLPKPRASLISELPSSSCNRFTGRWITIPLPPVIFWKSLLVGLQLRWHKRLVSKNTSCRLSVASPTNGNRLCSALFAQTNLTLAKSGPQITCAHQKGSLAPQINCVHFNKQPFRLGTGGDWGFRGGDRGQGTYTWRCSTMNKQPFRLGTGVEWGFRGGDRGQGTSTWRCSTMNKQQPFRLGTGGDWGFRGGDRGQWTYTWRCSTINEQTTTF